MPIYFLLPGSLAAQDDSWLLEHRRAVQTECKPLGPVTAGGQTTRVSVSWPRVRSSCAAPRLHKKATTYPCKSAQIMVLMAAPTGAAVSVLP